MRFQSPSKGILTFDQVVGEICYFLEEDPKCSYSLVVGTDSEDSLDEVDFVTAIVVHRKGKGGRYFWARLQKPRFHTLRERIWQEAILSISVAKSLVEELLEREVENSNVEIHVDIGEKGPSKLLIQEITGYVRGNGFVPFIKPEAYAAASVADRHV